MKKVLFFVSIFIVYVTVMPVKAGSSPITIDAGIIEWGEGYIQASEGFQVQYEGKNITGSNLYYNTITGEYGLNEVELRVCAKEKPHYMIYAKRLEIYPEEQLVFSGVKVRIGDRMIPIPMKLVLTYQQGRYEFPAWLPEVFYNQKGIGVRLRGTFAPIAKLHLTSLIEVSSLEGGDLYLSGKYTMSKDFYVAGNLKNEQRWAGDVALNWRKGKPGFHGYMNLFWGEGSKKQGYLGYTQRNWSIGTLVEESLQLRQIKLQISSPQQVIGGITQKFDTGVTSVTELGGNEEYNKLYLTNYLSDQYKLGKMTFGWQWNMSHNWVLQQAWKGHGYGEVFLSSPIGDAVSFRLGYGRSSEWGEELAKKYSLYEEKHNLNLAIQYSDRNELDEGWDLALKGRYDLLNSKFAEGDLHIVKAFDCFDLVVDLDLVDVGMKTRIDLKF